MHRSSNIVAKLKEKYPNPNQKIHAIDYVFFVEIRSKLFSKHFKNGVEDVAFNVDHENRTVKLNAINPYDILAEVDEDFIPANISYAELSEEMLA